MKKVKNFQLKIVIFTTVKNHCILHGHVFVMKPAFCTCNKTADQGLKLFSLHRFFLNQKIQTASHYLRLYSPVCVKPAWKTQRVTYYFLKPYMSLVMRIPAFCICEKQRRRSAAQLISTFDFTIRIVQSLYYLNPKFQSLSHLLHLYSLVCVGPARNHRRPVFSQ